MGTQPASDKDLINKSAMDPLAFAEASNMPVDKMNKTMMVQPSASNSGVFANDPKSSRKTLGSKGYAT